ncbi:hypothetical protein N7462_002911 [Penicillium macrosclerotiorum]|uniref:uncharacterized protein n=1 Tax=Penicillium macrosclerotiorum TaxID=303699 RepID=UPI0025482C5B|nr:uncharacterized protein N7462_002911 [Penicillium macrosclerotiorum]KAJ5688519.1 hypothetical protein N7462_002911 [Penicillium macrosclerotiorum]
MSAKKTHSHVIGNNRNIPTSQDKGKLGNPISVQLGTDLEKSNSLDSLEKPENVGRLKSTRTTFQKHWRRFWCCYLVAVVIFLAIFLPVFFLVAVPAIAQRIVNDTNLPVYSAQILDPKTNQVSFTLHTSLNVPLGLRIHTDPMNLSLFNRNTKPMEPYLVVALPAYSLKGNTNMSVTRNNTDILNQSEFMKVLTDAVYNKKFVMSAKGSTVGHLGALKTPLTLKGFSIDSARLLIPKEADGTNLAGVATLPNHSVFTFALGNVTLNLRSYNLTIGQATIPNVVLKPGNNTVSLRGYVNITTILDNLSDILSSQKTALLDGEVELSASGNSTIYNDVHIKYYEDVLNNLTLTTRVPILQVIGDTLDALQDDSDSSLGQLIQNVTSILGGLTNSSNISTVTRSIHSIT